MNKIQLCLIISLLGNLSYSQLVINEIDSDSPGIDDMEFIELKSNTPKMSLKGFVLVLFNGSSNGGNRSYFALELDNYTTDINGLLLIGSDMVSPSPHLRIFPNTIQNGADAVGIYLGDTTDFPDRTLATQTNLIDALAYDTNDPDATTLMNLLGLSQQFNEGANGNKNIESIQRNKDGTYFVGKPTPRQLNDGSGIIQNGVNILTTMTQFNEGDEIKILFFTERAVDDDFTFEFDLKNNGFTNADYSGKTTLTISKGDNKVTANILIIDDNLDEGDEEMIINLSPLPDEYLEINDNVLIRIVDNDFKIAPWGTPINPSFGIVKGTHAFNYYKNLNGLRDNDLKQGIQDIIADPTIVRAQTYNDIIDILIEADKNPMNSNEVWLLYTEQGRSILDFQTTSNNENKWNREHTFPRSRAGYFSIRQDEIRDGIDIYWNTNADSLRHGNSDAHGLKAADGRENSSRGNQHYGEYNGPIGNKSSFKGDVARCVFYMATRYNGLDIVNGFPDFKGQLGNLDSLLSWHRNDPPDDFEMNRNNVIYKWQLNRNPYIDQPAFIEYIWGDKKGQVWDKKIGSKDLDEINVQIFPNPSNGRINISGISEKTNVEIITIDGKYKKSIILLKDKAIDLNSGAYVIKLSTKHQSITKLVIVK